MRGGFSRRFLLILTFLGMGAAAASLPSQAATPTSPKAAAQFVDTLGQRAVKLLGAYDEGHAAQHQAEFKSLVREGFDLDLIGRFVLGGAWRTASEQQRAEYQKLFSDWVLDSYARRLGAYKGETFTITGSGPIADTDALVETQITQANGQPLKAGWRVREINGQMKIIDVMVEGVSMALTQRQEFASVIQRKGLDGLIADLRTRLQDLQAKQG